MPFAETSPQPASAPIYERHPLPFGIAYNTPNGDPTLPVKCDGDHRGPPCGDPECWNAPNPIESIKGLKKICDDFRAKLTDKERAIVDRLFPKFDGTLCCQPSPDGQEACVLMPGHLGPHKGVKSHF
jgi:hypothetical protein